MQLLGVTIRLINWKIVNFILQDTVQIHQMSNVYQEKIIFMPLLLSDLKTGFRRKAVLKYFTRVSGERFAMRVSIKQLQWLHVVNLAFVMVEQRFMDPPIGAWLQLGHQSIQQI